jgi:hypothetical protein
MLDILSMQHWTIIGARVCAVSYLPNSSETMIAGSGLSCTWGPHGRYGNPRCDRSGSSRVESQEAVPEPFVSARPSYLATLACATLRTTLRRADGTLPGCYRAISK